VIGKQLKYLASFVFLASLVFAVGCGKKTASAPPPPPPPPVVAPAPTAEITATPTVVTAGDKVVLAWRTTNAASASIDGIGTVSTEGTQTVNPTASTNYHLVARGDGGSSDATARVTVNTPPPPVATNNVDVVDEATFHQNVQDLFYDYDSYELRTDAQAVAAKNASFLVAHPAVKVVLGGYCDERGSTEYNLALGENRANAAKQALVTAGVSPDRLRVVSYGKEKQFCSEHDESCWQQNRRSQFSLDK
jgi:peptidoglycan-associated lipoprotein